VGERVTEQQIAVFVVDSGDGHGQLWKNRKADTDDDEEKADRRQPFAFGEGRKKRFHGVEKPWRQPGEKYGKKEEETSAAKEHTHRQSVNVIAHRKCEFSTLDCGTYGPRYKDRCCFPLMQSLILSNTVLEGSWRN
jgi:hypothetical protein